MGIMNSLVEQVIQSEEVTESRVEAGRGKLRRDTKEFKQGQEVDYVFNGLGQGPKLTVRIGTKTEKLEGSIQEYLQSTVTVDKDPSIKSEL